MMLYEVEHKLLDNGYAAAAKGFYGDSISGKYSDSVHGTGNIFQSHTLKTYEPHQIATLPGNGKELRLNYNFSIKTGSSEHSLNLKGNVNFRSDGSTNNIFSIAKDRDDTVTNFLAHQSYWTKEFKIGVEGNKLFVKTPYKVVSGFAANSVNVDFSVNGSIIRENKNVSKDGTGTKKDGKFIILPPKRSPGNYRYSGAIWNTKLSDYKYFNDSSTKSEFDSTNGDDVIIGDSSHYGSTIINNKQKLRSFANNLVAKKDNGRGAKHGDGFILLPPGMDKTDYSDSDIRSASYQAIGEGNMKSEFDATHGDKVIVANTDFTDGYTVADTDDFYKNLSNSVVVNNNASPVKGYENIHSGGTGAKQGDGFIGMPPTRTSQDYSDSDIKNATYHKINEGNMRSEYDATNGDHVIIASATENSYKTVGTDINEREISQALLSNVDFNLTSNFEYIYGK